MSSTRKNNNYNDFLIEQNDNLRSFNYLTTPIYSAPTTTFLPGNGLLQGKIAPHKIASNYCDIESNLRGIGSSNLVQQPPILKPNVYKLNSLDIVDFCAPELLPDNFTLLNNQRPNIQN